MVIGRGTNDTCVHEGQINSDTITKVFTMNHIA
jgi:hypothetical protein